MVIGYGDYPFRALWAMVLLITAFSFIYMVTGFNTGLGTNSHDINYSWDLEQLFIFPKTKIIDCLYSLYFSFFTLITVGQGSAYPITSWTQAFMAIELFSGAILVTLFTATLFRKYTK